MGVSVNISVSVSVAIVHPMTRHKHRPALVTLALCLRNSTPTHQSGSLQSPADSARTNNDVAGATDMVTVKLFHALTSKSFRLLAL